MGSDDIIPAGKCPKCGAELRIKQDDANLKGGERTICSVHGDVGSLEETYRVVLEKNRDQIVDHTKRIAIDRLRDSFRKAFRKKNIALTTS
jgi:hypothetical protein